MIELNYSSKEGRKIHKRGSQYDGYILEDVYAKPSQAKRDAYVWCYNEYLNTEEGEGFSICSHNTFQFTCSWLGKLNGEVIMRYETANNSYLIWLER